MIKDVEIQVRFNDLDGYAHVNNSVYLSYLEIARCSVFNDVFLKARDEGIWYVLISAEIKYKKFIKFDDKVFVSIKLAEAKGATFSFEYKVHNGAGVEFAEAKTSHTAFDSRLNMPVRVPEAILKFKK